jgi:Na+-transporting NADH:ubiquinone oxidoreductase subunit C
MAHDKNSVRYTVLFATAVCVVCALMVAVAAVALAPTQEAQARRYMQKNVLLAAGLLEPGAPASEAEQQRLFKERIEVRLIDFADARLVPADRIDAAGYDQRRARNDPAQSREAPANRAGIRRMANYGLVYFVRNQGRIEQVVLAVEGLGMWGTIYGFVALAPDGNTVLGLTYYDQKETPGLGGEIVNPNWQALWRGRRVYDDRWEPAITVVKGPAGAPTRNPQRVDGLSGATITSNAVTRLMQFWFSDPAYGRWLREFRAGNAEGRTKGLG